jgi:hypothetical protein
MDSGVEGDGVASFGKFDDDLVGGPFGAVILGQLGSEAAGLNTDHGVQLRIEVRLATKDFSGDLVFLDG